MPDRVLINKLATVERCVARAREEYAKNPAGFGADQTRQDAAILNIQRACETCLDIGQHVIRRDRLGLAQTAREIFAILAEAGRVAPDLAASLQRMVGFRNIAVHDYRKLQVVIVIAIIERDLEDCLVFARAMVVAPD